MIVSDLRCSVHTQSSEVAGPEAHHHQPQNTAIDLCVRVCCIIMCVPSDGFEGEARIIAALLLLTLCALCDLRLRACCVMLALIITLIMGQGGMCRVSHAPSSNTGRLTPPTPSTHRQHHPPRRPMRRLFSQQWGNCRLSASPSPPSCCPCCMRPLPARSPHAGTLLSSHHTPPHLSASRGFRCFLCLILDNQVSTLPLLGVCIGFACVGVGTQGRSHIFVGWRVFWDVVCTIFSCLRWLVPALNSDKTFSAVVHPAAAQLLSMGTHPKHP